METVIALVEYVARELATRREEVVLDLRDGDDGKVICLRTHPEDVGRIIGRNGRTINALRALVATVAGRAGLKVTVEVDAPAAS
ncbi:MAG TPA: KH domain-containing protein [Candidatus Hydrogenedentes bacterium]|mgnify:CR=1 FL=1|nr:KH domain-containing protein [Candidatus Hydrogenedentota bacterium]HOJ67631.1 KH domain-containing protein [Candidatus Hydrogenedentota bacterium]HOK88440.1 KH domain-containing protein [Candidatus Hydrogenedentota bacterium]HOV61327.1 KH domain-containing protein [Candidatus Hydrogenedentota bacterium]